MRVIQPLLAFILEVALMHSGNSHGQRSFHLMEEKKTLAFHQEL